MTCDNLYIVIIIGDVNIVTILYPFEYLNCVRINCTRFESKFS